MEEQIEKIKEEEKPEEVSTPAKTKRVVGVQHRVAGDIYTFAVPELELNAGDQVVVEGEHGESVGIVVTPPHDTNEKEVPRNVRSVLRLATNEDLTAHYSRREEAREYFEVCEERIAEHTLPMKLVDAELTEGGKKVIFFFFAEQRVDFRYLVKDLASQFHKYIEMRQIGSRDASSFLGCMGPCGRATCCSTFLRDFHSISIAMAKNQGLSPNPAKLTGMCGKLKCCLDYENKAYSELRKGLPKYNSWVETPRGVGKISKLDILRQQCCVRLESGGEAKFPCGECKATQARRQEQSDKGKPPRKDAKQRERRPPRKDRSTTKPTDVTPPAHQETGSGQAEKPESKSESDDKE
jgi:cell fate regulator YaaT (PSP1 superfamily)